MLFFFFFSSRRRHTRFKCDWSSDVCSSDLEAVRPLPVASGRRTAASGLGDVEAPPAVEVVPGQLEAGGAFHLERIHLAVRQARVVTYQGLDQAGHLPGIGRLIRRAL